MALTGEAGGPELDLAVPAIDRGAELPASAGLAPILGCRERAAAFAEAVLRSSAARVRDGRRIDLGALIIYGINPVLEALRAGASRHAGRATRGPAHRGEVLLAAARRRAGRSSVRRCELDRAARGGVHQGVVGGRRRAAGYDVADLVRQRRAAPLIVVLDGIEDPHNLGAILRVADAAGADGVVRQTRHAAALGRHGGQGLGRRDRARADGERRQHRPGDRRTEGRPTSGRWGSPVTRAERYDRTWT